MTNETVIAILSELKKCYLGGVVDALDFAIEAVKEQDPVVRCKDCEHCYYASNRVPAEQSHACIMLGIDVQPDFYCAYGEHRDGDA